MQQLKSARKPPARKDNPELAEIHVSGKRGSLTMGLLWLTLLTSFPALLIGFEWYRQGIALSDLLISLAISACIILAYSVPICLLSASTGLSFKMLSRPVFGLAGNKMLVGCLIFLFFGWYTVCALLMADVVCGLFGLKSIFVGLAVAFTFAMAINNFFGFTGVANFSKYVAAPVLIAWVLTTFCKIAPSVSSTLLLAPGKAGFVAAFTTITSFTIGFFIWGNEADYWRHCRPKAVPIALALACALFVGEFVFPLTGWLIAAKFGITDSTVATGFLNQFSFAGLSVLAVLVLGANYFAANDANLYALVHACEGAGKMSHRSAVFLVTAVCSLASFLLARLGAAGALEQICALNCIIIPTATVIVMAEWLFLSRRRRCLEQVVPLISWPAIVAFAAGMTLGLITSGIVPALSKWHVGLPPLQAWALALAIYIPWRLKEIKAAKVSAAAENVSPLTLEPMVVQSAGSILR